MDRCLDRQIWRIIFKSVGRATQAIKSPGRRPRYPNRLIVAMYFWSVWHDRCLSWACDKEHYNSLFHPRGVLPSISQFTRRIKTDICQRILQKVHDDLAARGIASRLGYMDGKPMVVSAVSKDPDARSGHISGGFAKGYKLHACIGQDRRIKVWAVSPLNIDEKAVARQLLLGQLPLPPDPLNSLILADKNYDAASLYNAFAASGQALLTPLRATHLAGSNGRHPRTLQTMGPIRREAVHLWEHHRPLVKYVMKQRNNAEGVFSVLAVALGLNALPAFVRRLDRVRRWIGTKIILYHARLIAQEAAQSGVGGAA
jgi:Transposase DDE domain